MHAEVADLLLNSEGYADSPVIKAANAAADGSVAVIAVNPNVLAAAAVSASRPRHASA